jgi:hypothetical protein
MRECKINQIRRVRQERTPTPPTSCPACVNAFMRARPKSPLAPTMSTRIVAFTRAPRHEPLNFLGWHKLEEQGGPTQTHFALMHAAGMEGFARTASAPTASAPTQLPVQQTRERAMQRLYFDVKHHNAARHETNDNQSRAENRAHTQMHPPPESVLRVPRGMPHPWLDALALRAPRKAGQSDLFSRTASDPTHAGRHGSDAGAFGRPIYRASDGRQRSATSKRVESATPMAKTQTKYAEKFNHDASWRDGGVRNSRLRSHANFIPITRGFSRSQSVDSSISPIPPNAGSRMPGAHDPFRRTSSAGEVEQRAANKRFSVDEVVDLAVRQHANASKAANTLSGMLPLAHDKTKHDDLAPKKAKIRLRRAVTKAAVESKLRSALEAINRVVVELCEVVKQKQQPLPSSADAGKPRLSRMQYKVKSRVISL